MENDSFFYTINRIYTSSSRLDFLFNSSIFYGEEGVNKEFVECLFYTSFLLEKIKEENTDGGFSLFLVEVPDADFFKKKIFEEINKQDIINKFYENSKKRNSVKLTIGKKYREEIIKRLEELLYLYAQNITNTSYDFFDYKYINQKHYSFVTLLQNIKEEVLTIDLRIDELTGLYNRKILNSVLVEMQEKEYDTYIILADIDNFKSINDTYGHQDGDVALSVFSEVIQKSINEEDYAFRYGGEEFLILLSDISMENAISKANSIREKLKEKDVVMGNGSVVNITASFGVSELEKGKSPIDSIQSADGALYKAKNSGKNRVEFF